MIGLFQRLWPRADLPSGGQPGDPVGDGVLSKVRDLEEPLAFLHT